MLSIRESGEVFSSQVQNILETPFQVIWTSEPKLYHDWYVVRNTILTIETNNRDEKQILDLCEQLLLSGKLMSDGVDPFFSEFFILYSEKVWIFMEICSYAF